MKLSCFLKLALVIKVRRNSYVCDYSCGLLGPASLYAQGHWSQLQLLLHCNLTYTTDFFSLSKQYVIICSDWISVFNFVQVRVFPVNHLKFLPVKHLITSWVGNWEMSGSSREGLKRIFYDSTGSLKHSARSILHLADILFSAKNGYSLINYLSRLPPVLRFWKSRVQTGKFDWKLCLKRLLVGKLFFAERVIYVKCIFGVMKGSAQKLLLAWLFDKTSSVNGAWNCSIDWLGLGNEEFSIMWWYRYTWFQCNNLKQFCPFVVNSNIHNWFDRKSPSFVIWHPNS